MDQLQQLVKTWRVLARTPPMPSAPGVTAALIFNWSLAMKTERFAGHHEAREALVLAVAGVTAIMLIESYVRPHRVDDLRRQRLFGAPCGRGGEAMWSEPGGGRSACRADRELGGRTRFAHEGLRP